MEYRTSDGTSFHVLPDCARCRYANEHPGHMDECPTRAFDPLGLICLPEICEYYAEDW